jgi:glycosyltransferase involved in cell wall biosynthesis
MDSRDTIDFAQGNLKTRLRHQWFQLIYGLSATLLDGQTAITPRMAELVGIPPQQLWGVWPSGVNPQAFGVAYQKRCWPAASVGDTTIHLAYLGIFLEKRNLLPFCRAVKRAYDEGMQFIFSLYGHGPLAAELKAFATQTRGAVRVQQPIPHEQLPDLLAQVHVGVTSLPDPNDIKYGASSPLKLFEYMAAGLPILATSNKCYTDVIGSGRYVFWATEASEEALLDALRQIWQMREELPRLGRQAMAAAQSWTWTAAAKKLYAALLYGASCTSQPAYGREIKQRVDLSK